MRTYLLRRLLVLPLMLLLITIIQFGLIHLAPGDPTTVLFSEVGTVSAEDAARIRALHGLDRPIVVQYLIWVGRMARGDFGISYYQHQPVLDLIADRLPNSLQLMGLAMLLSLVVAIPAGVWVSLHKYTVTDHIVSFLTYFGVSMPSFWFGLMLMWLFAVQLGILPATGMATIGAPFSLVDRALHLIMPSVVLASANMAQLTRYTRASMLEVLQEDYVRTARSKGLAERVVVYKHVLRNALVSVVTMLALFMPALFGGSFIVESVFAWPGMGRLGINAVYTRDYPLIMGINLILVCMVLMSNLAADLFYAFLDPRIRYDG